MAFYEVIGWGVFWIALILAIVLFTKYRRLSHVFYLCSVSLYIFTAGYMIDIFSIGRLGILATLIISALIFMGLGYYLSQVFGDQKK